MMQHNQIHVLSNCQIDTTLCTFWKVSEEDNFEQSVTLVAEIWVLKVTAKDTGRVEL